MNTAQDSNPPGEWYCPTCEKQFPAGDRCPTDGTRLVKLKVAIDPFIGKELDGRYTILEKLGQGGMGAVYRSSQHSVGRDCAIKVISSNLVSEADVIKRFLREAKLASRLSHPNAVAVLDFGQTDDGVFYLVMELVAGRTLDQVFKAEKTFKPERVVRIGAQICDALEGAHSLQIVHRDLKPSNIMLLNKGRDLVKVLDFGLAKSVAPDQTSTTMTNAGALLGTPAFMPPELALGQPCDGRADLYSLGCVLYLLGSGRLPFQSTSAHELIAMHGTEPVPPMTGVPTPLAKVTERMLEKDPDKRYQSAAETREALEAAIDGRMYTPPVGVPIASETNPSIGPFPMTTEDLMHDETMPPPSASSPTMRRASSRPRMSAELEQLVTSDTIGVNDTIAKGPRPSMTVMPTPATATSTVPLAKKRGWIVPVIAVAALAAGGGMFALSRGGSKPAAPPPVQQPVVQQPVVQQPVVQQPVVQQPVAVPAEPAKPVDSPKPVETTPESTKPAEPSTPPPPTDKTVKPTKHVSTKASTKPVTTKPAETKPTTKPAETKPTTKPAETRTTKPVDTKPNKPALPF